MALHYFIDGYNVIWSPLRQGYGGQAPLNFNGATLREQREKLLRFLEKERPAGSERNRVTVVFDGLEDVDGPPWRGSVRVIFSKGTDADAVIKRCVDEMTNGRDAVVVTNDRDIQKWVRASKAKVLSCEAFLRGMSRKAAPKPDRPARGSPDPESVDKINDELKRLWKL